VRTGNWGPGSPERPTPITGMLPCGSDLVRRVCRSMRDASLGIMSSRARVHETSPVALPWGRAGVAALRAAMLGFFAESRRDLPWRGDVDPYRVLVSEFMLQQTRVDTVVPYFLKWMERFPTLHSLAEADGEEVLRLWQGLGYYSRARRLQEVVREVEARYGGAIPSDPRLLEAMTGIGPYTAGAVASIAFGVPVGAVDGNVRRVLSRLLDEPRPSARRLEQVASALVDPDQPGEFNQAMMELGSLVCTPRVPKCESCPVRPICRARAAGTWLERPMSASRGPIRKRIEVVAVLVGWGADCIPGARRGRVAEDLSRSGRWRALLRKRPPQGLLAGMWEFPGLEVADGTDPGARIRELAGALLDEAGLSSVKEAGCLDGRGAPVALPPFEHLFSHLRVRYLPYVFRVAVPRGLSTPTGTYRWASARDAVDVPLPAAQRTLWASVEAEFMRDGAPVPKDTRQEE